LARPRENWEKPQKEIATMRAVAEKAFRLPNVQAGCHSYFHPLSRSEGRFRQI